MKTKDIKYLVLAAVILIVAGYLVYTQLMPQKDTEEAKKDVTVEVVGEIPETLNSDGLAAIRDPNKAAPFDSPIDLSGLNNKAPFGQ